MPGFKISPPQGSTHFKTFPLNLILFDLETDHWGFLKRERERSAQPLDFSNNLLVQPPFRRPWLLAALLNCRQLQQFSECEREKREVSPRRSRLR